MKLRYVTVSKAGIFRSGFASFFFLSLDYMHCTFESKTIFLPPRFVSHPPLRSPVYSPDDQPTKIDFNNRLARGDRLKCKRFDATLLPLAYRYVHVYWYTLSGIYNTPCVYLEYSLYRFFLPDGKISFPPSPAKFPSFDTN